MVQFFASARFFRPKGKERESNNVCVYVNIVYFMEITKYFGCCIFYLCLFIYLFSFLFFIKLFVYFGHPYANKSINYEAKFIPKSNKNKKKNRKHTTDIKNISWLRVNANSFPFLLHLSPFKKSHTQSNSVYRRLTYSICFLPKHRIYFFALLYLSSFCLAKRFLIQHAMPLKCASDAFYEAFSFPLDNATKTEWMHI